MDIQRIKDLCASRGVRFTTPQVKQKVRQLGISMRATDEIDYSNRSSFNFYSVEPADMILYDHLNFKWYDKVLAPYVKLVDGRIVAQSLSQEIEIANPRMVTQRTAELKVYVLPNDIPEAIVPLVEGGYAWKDRNSLYALFGGSTRVRGWYPRTITVDGQQKYTMRVMSMSGEQLAEIGLIRGIDNNYYTSDAQGVNSPIGFIPQALLDNGEYLQCPDCGEYYRRGGHCSCHAVSESELRRIQPYHWGHDPSRAAYLNKAIYGEGEAEDEIHGTYGVEIETTAQEDLVHDHINTKLFHAERDGSISGAEFISRPLTFKAWSERFMNLVNMTQGLISHGAKGHDAGTGYGLHVHIGRKSFKDEDAMLRFVCLMNKFKNGFVALARRDGTTGGCSGWHLISDLMVNKKKAKDLQAQWRNSRYNAVNFNNPNTIEIRIFRSTLNATTLMGTLQILDNLVNIANAKPAEVKFADLCAGQYASVLLDDNNIRLSRYVNEKVEFNMWDVANPEMFERQRDLIARLQAAKAAVMSLENEISRFNASNPELAIEGASITPENVSLIDEEEEND